LQSHYIAGICLLMLATVSPDWNAVDAAGRVTCSLEATTLGYSLWPMRMTARQYFRWYYVLLSLCLCFHPLFNTLWMFVCITCLWPLFYQEVIDPNENVGVIFKVRAFMLISQAAMMDSCINIEAINMSSMVPFPHVGNCWIVNAVGAAIIIFFVLAFHILDRARPPVDEKAWQDSDQAGIQKQKSLEVECVRNLEEGLRTFSLEVECVRNLEEGLPTLLSGVFEERSKQVSNGVGVFKTGLEAGSDRSCKQTANGNISHDEPMSPDSRASDGIPNECQSTDISNIPSYVDS